MLGAAQIRRFEADGFLIVPDVLDGASLRAVREDYHRRAADLCRRTARLGYAIECGDNFADNLTQLICATPRAYEHLDISLPMVSDMAARADEWRALFGEEWTVQAGFFFPDSVFRLVSHPAVLAVVSRLLGDDIQLSPVQHVRIKPPQRLLPEAAVGDANVARTLWHQDEAVVAEDARDADILTVWMAVSDATVENGCMWAAAGSHRTFANDGQRADFGLATHCPGKQLAGEIYIPDGAVDKEKLTPLEARAGSLVLLHQRTVHGAGANNSSDIRWSFDLRYQTAGAPSGRECFPSYPLAGKSRPAADCGEEYRRLWRAARDDIIAGRVRAVFNGRWDKYQQAPLCA